jgi:hypothetical protein
MLLKESQAIACQLEAVTDTGVFHVAPSEDDITYPV